MALMIQLDEPLLKRLQLKAKESQLSVEQLVLDILSDAVKPQEDFPTLEEVVARIKNTPPNPASIRLATGSLADHLRNAPDDPDFDLETWTREWEQIEAEMKATTILNRIAEENL
jgi:hypothetical protein